MAVSLYTRIKSSVQQGGTNVLIALAVAVGIVTGGAAILFGILLRTANHVFFGLSDYILTGFATDMRYKYWLPLIPALGGLIVGPIVFIFAREARGHGVPEVMNAVARLGGIIRPRVAAAKTLASAICIGSGGSAGREGPIVQIGSAIGSTFGQVMHMPSQRVRLLVGCGAAAGISSVFNAPIAGVTFAVEVILGDFAIDTFAPLLVSSVIASVVTRSVLGNHPAFQVPAYELKSAYEIPMYIVMGVLLGAVAVLFTRTLSLLEDWFEGLKLSNVFKPALGGLLLGIIAIFLPQVLADGYQTITLTLHGQLAVTLMAGLVFAKIIGTSLTLGSGGSGGIFAPSLFLGAMAGGSYGYALSLVWPQRVASPGAYALVGMAGVVAATTHAPLTAILIIFEMTNDYRIILPLMVAVAISSAVAKALYGPSIYTDKLLRRGIDIRSGRDVAVLRSSSVAEVMDCNVELIQSNLPLNAVFRKMETLPESSLVVINSAGNLRGLLTFQDLRTLVTQRHADQLIVAEDLVHRPLNTIRPYDSLEVAMEQLNATGAKLLPVVDGPNGEKVVGVVRRDNLIDFYNRRLLEAIRR